MQVMGDRAQSVPDDYDEEYDSEAREQHKSFEETQDVRFVQ